VLISWSSKAHALWRLTCRSRIRTGTRSQCRLMMSSLGLNVSAYWINRFNAVLMQASRPEDLCAWIMYTAEYVGQSAADIEWRSTSYSAVTHHRFQGTEARLWTYVIVCLDLLGREKVCYMEQQIRSGNCGWTKTALVSSGKSVEMEADGYLQSSLISNFHTHYIFHNVIF